MAASIKFDAYKLIEISYKPSLIDDSSKLEEGLSKPARNKKKKKYNISVSTNTAVGREEKNKYRMELTINVSGTIDAIISLYGYFTGTGFYESDEIELREVISIGISLLLPIARSILASVTAQDGSTPFLLPTFNVSEMLINNSDESVNN